MAVTISPMPTAKRRGIAGRHIVTQAAPAKAYHHAFLTGNGTLLLSDAGHPGKETLILRHEELAAPQWRDPPKAPYLRDHLEDIRALILAGKYEEAAQLADMAAAQNGTPPTFTSGPHHPAILLELDQPVRQANDYISTLDMRTSVIKIQWGDQGLYTRESFCSRGDHIAVIRLTAPRGKLCLTVKGTFPELKYHRGTWESNDIPHGRSGQFDCQAVPPRVSIEHLSNAILLTGTYAYHKGGFSTAARIACTGGSMAAAPGGISIQDASEALILLSCKRCPDAAALLHELEAIPADYVTLLERHTAVHQPLFDRLSVDLGGDPEDYLLSTVELKQKQFTSPQIVPAYLEAMVDMGRFFLLNECGNFPPIYGHVNVNVNHQVSGGNIGSLPEMMDSFFRWIEWQLPDARENAQRILGARGFFLACHPDEESGNLYHFNEYWPHQFWISSSGWCLNPFLEHYYCTGDEGFLRQRLIPLYKELALLYEDFLTCRDENGKRMFIPSYSPENFPSNVPVMAVINAVMDISVCREVLETLLTLGVQAGMVTGEERGRWQALLDELPPYLTGEYGELKEWAREEFEERYDHRHASQLYGAYPGDEFQPERDEALYRAAFISNRMRAMGNESCHGIMHRAQAAARLKDPWLVQSLLRFTLESGYVNDNFTTCHNPYVHHMFPDGQGAIPTVLLESLLYARPGFLEPLPALLGDSFPTGTLKGMSARTFARIDELSWDLPKGELTLRFTSFQDQEILFCLRRGFRTLAADGASVVEEPGKDPSRYRRVTVQKGTPVLLRLTGIG